MYCSVRYAVHPVRRSFVGLPTHPTTSIEGGATAITANVSSKTSTSVSARRCARQLRTSWNIGTTNAESFSLVERVVSTENRPYCSGRVLEEEKGKKLTKQKTKWSLGWAIQSTNYWQQGSWANEVGIQPKVKQGRDTFYPAPGLAIEHILIGTGVC